eukprot:1274526-Amphidinium_carterae.2
MQCLLSCDAGRVAVVPHGQTDQVYARRLAGVDWSEIKAELLENRRSTLMERSKPPQRYNKPTLATQRRTCTRAHCELGRLLDEHVALPDADLDITYENDSDAQSLEEPKILQHAEAKQLAGKWGMHRIWGQKAFQASTSLRL